MKNKEIIKEEISYIENEFDLYSYLSLYANKSILPFNIRKEDNLVRGCNSDFWVYVIKKNGRIFPYCDSDSLVMKGIGQIVCEYYFDRSINDCKTDDFTLFNELKFYSIFSQQRLLGVTDLINNIKSF